jgi:hypothetical protein
MPRSWGRNNQVKLGACAHGSLLEVERLEHRVALSAAPITPTDSVLVWSAKMGASSPVRFISPAPVEASRVSYSSPESATTWAVAAQTPILARVGSFQESNVANATAFERVAASVENVAVSSQKLPAPIIGIEYIEGFRIDRAGEPISVIIDRLPLDKIEWIEHVRILPAPHEGELLPIDGVTILPAYDWKPGEGHAAEPGFWGRMPSFVANPDTAPPMDGVVVDTTTHVVSGETHALASGVRTVAVMQFSPIAWTVAGAVAGQVGKVPWLLPQVEVSTDVRGGEQTDVHEPAGTLRSVDKATVFAPSVGVGAGELVAKVETAFAALGDLAPQADLLASIDLGTAALDDALASVMNEVEDLGSEFLTWIDEAGVNGWARSAAALAAMGVGGAIVLRWRVKRTLDEQGDSESTTWLFHQLQNSTGEV